MGRNEGWRPALCLYLARSRSAPLLCHTSCSFWGGVARGSLWGIVCPPLLCPGAGPSLFLAPEASGRGTCRTHCDLLPSVAEWEKTFEEKLTPLFSVRESLSEEEAQKMGKKDPDQEVEKFVTANTQELGKDKWLCPLSGKKFKVGSPPHPLFLPGGDARSAHLSPFPLPTGPRVCAQAHLQQAR